MPQAPKAERERVPAIFRAAYEAGDLTGLVRLLHPDAVYVTDGGGKAAAARELIHGGERVAEVMVRELSHPEGLSRLPDENAYRTTEGMPAGR